MNVRQAFADQAISCRALGSELTARVVERLGEALQQSQGAVAQRVLAWPGDASSRGDSVPLRLAGALHALVLSGASAQLARAYAERDPSADLLIETTVRHEAHVMDWLNSPPQTNEVGRSAPLIAAARFLAAMHPLPFEILELGASAGLNLNFHRYLLAPGRGTKAQSNGATQPGKVLLMPEWRGELPMTNFDVIAAAGVDLRPIDAVQTADRLLAYCWADQPLRMARLQAALVIARHHRPIVEQGDAAGWLHEKLSRATATGRLRMVFHTVAWQYFPPETQAACEAAMRDAGAAASANNPLAHVSMEADGGRGAALHLRLWADEVQEWALGRADFHGRWVEWAPVRK